MLGVSGQPAPNGLFKKNGDCGPLPPVVKVQADGVDLEHALSGQVAEERLRLQMHLERIDDLNVRIGKLDDELRQQLSPLGHDAYAERYDVLQLDDSVPRDL
jgi:hypothetical protein